MGAKKSDELKKLLFEEPIRTDLHEALSGRLQDVGVHSAMADPAAQFIADLYVEGLDLIRLLAPAAKNPDKAPAELAAGVHRSASYLEQRSAEGLGFLERASTFLDKRVEEDAADTEAFEKNVARYEKAGRLDNARGLAARLSPGSEEAVTHGGWALDNIYGCLVKLVGIVELMRFERASSTTLLNGLAEIHLDITHRLRPGLLGNDEGRTGLLSMVGADAGRAAPAEADA
jgi:hypothetical protein